MFFFSDGNRFGIGSVHLKVFFWPGDEIKCGPFVGSMCSRKNQVMIEYSYLPE